MLEFRILPALFSVYPLHDVIHFGSFTRDAYIKIEKYVQHTKLNKDAKINLRFSDTK